jgi:hypothetical protein
MPRLIPLFAATFLLALSSCMQGIADPGSSYRKGLPRDAWRTQDTYDQALLTHTQKARSDIPSIYWGPGIAQLQPIQVYTHRVNLVVVQSIHEGHEHGLYIHLPTSRLHPRKSWTPKTGVDGFTFRRSSKKDVFHFTRPIAFHHGME